MKISQTIFNFFSGGVKNINTTNVYNFLNDFTEHIKKDIKEIDNLLKEFRTKEALDRINSIQEEIKTKLSSSQEISNLLWLILTKKAYIYLYRGEIDKYKHFILESEKYLVKENKKEYLEFISNIAHIELLNKNIEKAIYRIENELKENEYNTQLWSTYIYALKLKGLSLEEIYKKIPDLIKNEDIILFSLGDVSQSENFEEALKFFRKYIKKNPHKIFGKIKYVETLIGKYSLQKNTDPILDFNEQNEIKEAIDLLLGIENIIEKSDVIWLKFSFYRSIYIGYKLLNNYKSSISFAKKCPEVLSLETISKIDESIMFDIIKEQVIISINAEDYDYANKLLNEYLEKFPNLEIFKKLLEIVKNPNNKSKSKEFLIIYLKKINYNNLDKIEFLYVLTQFRELFEDKAIYEILKEIIDKREFKEKFVDTEISFINYLLTGNKEYLSDILKNMNKITNKNLYIFLIETVKNDTLRIENQEKLLEIIYKIYMSYPKIKFSESHVNYIVKSLFIIGKFKYCLEIIECWKEKNSLIKYELILYKIYIFYEIGEIKKVVYLLENHINDVKKVRNLLYLEYVIWWFYFKIREDPKIPIKEFEKIIDFSIIESELKNIDIATLIKLAQILAKFDYIPRALELLYRKYEFLLSKKEIELWQEAFLNFIMVYGEELEYLLEQPEINDISEKVILEKLDGKEEKEIDRYKDKIVFNELLNKKQGEIVSLKGEKYKIKKIFSKYLVLYQSIFKQFELVESSFMKSLKIKEDDTEDLKQKFLELFSQDRKNKNLVVDMYKKNEIPIASAAKFLQISKFDLINSFASDEKIGIISQLINEEFQMSKYDFQDLVIDLETIYILYTVFKENDIDILNILRNANITPIISFSTLEEVKILEEKLKNERKGQRLIEKNGKLSLVELSEEEIKEIVNRISTFKNWIIENTEIKPINYYLDFNRHEILKLKQLISNDSVDSIHLYLSDNNYAFLSIDRVILNLTKEISYSHNRESKLFTIQAFLDLILNKGLINKKQYYLVISSLLNLNIKYLLLKEDDFIDALEVFSLKFNSNIENLLKIFKYNYLSINVSIKLAINFFWKLEDTKISEMHKIAIYQKVLQNITGNFTILRVIEEMKILINKLKNLEHIKKTNILDNINMLEKAFPKNLNT